MSEVEVVKEKAIVKLGEVLKSESVGIASQLRNHFGEMADELEKYESDIFKIMEMGHDEDSCKKADKMRMKLVHIWNDAEKERLKENKAERDTIAVSIENRNASCKIFQNVVNAYKDVMIKKVNYWDDLTKKAIEDNRVERMEKFNTLDPDFVEPAGLGEWEEDHFKMIFDGTEKKYIDAAIAVVELKKITDENKRVADLQTKRVIQCSRIAYLIEDFENIDFGNMPDDKYESLVNAALNKRALEIEEEAYLYNIAFDDEKVLTDKADLFVTKLLKDGYIKRRSGDYIKDEYTISYDSLKTFNKREFSDRVKGNNNLIQAKEDNKKSEMLIVETEAYAYNDRINEAAAKLQVEINLSWTEAIEYNKQFDVDLEIKKLASSSDKVKLNKFAEDLENFINKYTIDLESVEAQDSFKYSVSRIEEHIKDIIVLSDEL